MVNKEEQNHEQVCLVRDHSDVVAEVRAAYAVFSEGYPV